MFTARSAMNYLGYEEPTQNYILELYNAPYRKFHNERHLDAMLRWVTPEQKNLKQVLEAVIFHRVILCDLPTPKGFNTAASVAVFSALKAGREGEEMDFGAMLIPVEAINATLHHDCDQAEISEVTETLLDLDLQILAQPEFEQVRAWISQFEARGVERKKAERWFEAFLKLLQQRNNLYYQFKEWEEPARKNIAILLGQK